MRAVFSILSQHQEQVHDFKLAGGKFNTNLENIILLKK